MGHSESMSDTHKRLMDYVTQKGMAPFRVCPLCNGKGVTLNRVLEGWPSTTLASGEVKRMTPVVRDRLVSCQVCEGNKMVPA